MRRILPHALILLAIVARADGPRSQGLGARLSASPLAMRQLAHDVGDGVLLRVLQAEQPARRDVLAALRAAPFAEAPELLVPALSRWAKGRDPALAPAAARALVEIAASLTPDALAAREVDPGTLRAAREALGELRNHAPAPRADIVFAAGLLDAALSDLLAQLGLSS